MMHAWVSGRVEPVWETERDRSFTHTQNGEFTEAQPIYTELIARRREERPVNPIKLSRGACVRVM